MQSVDKKENAMIMVSVRPDINELNYAKFRFVPDAREGLEVLFSQGNGIDVQWFREISADIKLEREEGVGLS